MLIIEYVIITNDFSLYIYILLLLKVESYDFRFDLEDPSTQ